MTDLDSPPKRHAGAALLAAAICIFLMTFLVSYALLGEQRLDLALNAIESAPFDRASSQVSNTKPQSSSCKSFDDCYKELAARSLVHRGAVGTVTLDVKRDMDPDAATGETAWVLLRFDLSFPPGTVVDADTPMVVNFPNFSYKRAAFFWNGRFQKGAFDGERLFLPFAAGSLKASGLSIDLILDTRVNDLKTLVDWREPFFAASHAAYQRYVDRIYMSQTGKGEQVGMIARVVLALLTLLFYLTLDSSASALGLALAMGFDAAGMCISNVGLEHQWIEATLHWKFLRLCFYCIADFMKLYFLLQMSGTRRPGLRPLLLAGIAFGAIYGSIMVYFPNGNISSIWLWFPRMTATSGIGIAFCSVALVAAIKKRDFWKSTALLLAMAGASVDLVDAGGSLFDSLDSNSAYIVSLTLAKALKAYVYTLSGLVGVAAMRKELRLLTLEREKNRKMEHEMQLGREMQKTLLSVPPLPPGIEVHVSYEAAAYVSGDTYFIDWNPLSRIFTVLLNDVTGHGLQAALKAFACNVIAKSIWNHAEARRDRRKRRSKFPLYEDQVTELLLHRTEGAFNAFVGFELAVDRRVATIYRCNYAAPILVRREPDSDKWVVRSISIHNRAAIDIPFGPGDYLLIASDGLLPTSKSQFRLLRTLGERLHGVGDDLTPLAVANLAFGDGADEDVNMEDDRSLIVFYWSRTTAIEDGLLDEDEREAEDIPA